jgi:predicted negative regulator of RcsB-dependent stress response
VLPFQNIKDESFKALMLHNIADQLAELGKFDQALQVAQTLQINTIKPGQWLRSLLS